MKPGAKGRNRAGLGEALAGAMERHARAAGAHPPAAHALSAHPAGAHAANGAEPAAPERGRLRKLTDEEIALWLAVARTVAPLPGAAKPAQPATPEPPPAPAAKPAPGKPAPAKKPVAAPRPPAPSAPAPPAPAHAAIPPLAPLERRLRQKLSRGRAAPDAAIDLHGLRRHEASLALRQFLLRAQLDGAKVVLVVTGKGRAAGAEAVSFEDEPGVLRRSVPLWLRGPDYHAIVVGFEEASRPHGGAGALYVRLRRRRAHMQD